MTNFSHVENPEATGSLSVIIQTSCPYDAYGEPGTAHRDMARVWIPGGGDTPPERTDLAVAKALVLANTVAAVGIDVKCCAGIDTTPPPGIAAIARAIAAFAAVSKQRPVVRFADFSLVIAHAVVDAACAGSTFSRDCAIKLSAHSHSCVSCSIFSGDGALKPGAMSDFDALAEIVPAGSKISIKTLAQTRSIKFASPPNPLTTRVGMVLSMTPPRELDALSPSQSKWGDGLLPHRVEKSDLRAGDPVLVFYSHPESTPFDVCLLGAHFSELANFSGAGSDATVEAIAAKMLDLGQREKREEFLSRCSKAKADGDDQGLAAAASQQVGDLLMRMSSTPSGKRV